MNTGRGEVMRVGFFDKQTILFEGTNKFQYHEYQEILRRNHIRFKAYATDDQLRGGCCGLNCGNGLGSNCFTYVIFVSIKNADKANELVNNMKTNAQITDEYDSI